MFGHRIPICILAFCFFGVGRPAHADRLTLTSQSLKSLLERKNSRVAAAKLDVEAAQGREGFLARSFLPSLRVVAGEENFQTGSLERKQQSRLGAEARMNLFNGGRDRIENDLRSLETQKREFQSRRVIAEELIKARTVYWQIIYLQEKISLLKSTLILNQKNLSSAQRRIRSGVAIDSDRFEFEMKDVDLRRELTQTETELKGHIRFLRIALGVNPELPLEFSEILNHKHGSHEQQYETALKHTSEEHKFLIKEFEIHADQQSISAVKERRAWWPKLDAFAAFNQYTERLESAGPGLTEDQRRETVFGLQLEMSLSSGLESRTEAINRAKEAAAARDRADYHKREMEAQFEDELAELKLLHEQVHEAEQNISRAQQYYKLTQSEYARGVKNSPDVLGASEKLFDMSHKRLEIIKNFQISKAHVLSKMGL